MFRWRGFISRPECGSCSVRLPLDLRRAAGVPRGQKLKASAAPGRIVLEMESAAQGKIFKRGKLKLWTGNVPSTPLAEAVESARHSLAEYERAIGEARPRGVMGGGIYDSLPATFARGREPGALSRAIRHLSPTLRPTWKSSRRNDAG